MKKIVKLTESDLVRLVKRVIKEQTLGDVKNSNSDFDFTSKFPESRQFIGDTFTLFKDMGEKEVFIKNGKIGGTGIYPSHTRPLLMMNIQDYPLGKYEGEPYTFNCSTGVFSSSRSGMKVFNKQMSNKLKSGLCQSNGVINQWNKPPENEKISNKS
jgi:hypothetical protein